MLQPDFLQSSTCCNVLTAIQRFHFATLAFWQKNRLVQLLYQFSFYGRHIEFHQTEMNLGLFQDSRLLPLCTIQNCRLSWLDLIDALNARFNVPTFPLLFSEARLWLKLIFLYEDSNSGITVLTPQTLLSGHLCLNDLVLFHLCLSATVFCFSATYFCHRF